MIAAKTEFDCFRVNKILFIERFILFYHSKDKKLSNYQIIVKIIKDFACKFGYISRRYNSFLM